MSDLSQAQYHACFNMSNHDDGFADEMDRLGIDYSMRPIASSYPQVHESSLPEHLKLVVMNLAIERMVA